MSLKSSHTCSGTPQWWHVNELCAWFCCAGWVLFCPPSPSSSAWISSTPGEVARLGRAQPVLGWMATGRPLCLIFPPSRHQSTTMTARLLESTFHMGAFCQSFMWRTCITSPTLRFTAPTGECVPLTPFSAHSSSSTSMGWQFSCSPSFACWPFTLTCYASNPGSILLAMQTPLNTIPARPVPCFCPCSF